MKKYLLFSYGSFYPCGGFNDFVESFDNIEDAKKYYDFNLDTFFYQIVDISTGKIIETNDI